MRGPWIEQCTLFFWLSPSRFPPSPGPPHRSAGPSSIHRGPRCRTPASDWKPRAQRSPRSGPASMAVFSSSSSHPADSRSSSPPPASPRRWRQSRPIAAPVQITLRPAAFFEEVNVTSSRADLPRTDPTVTVTVISSSDLATSAPLTLDDALKMVPGFTLFRRTSSRTANPTTQGVALRGIGGTAQSRSLVLADGLPLNDAFGGWVYWSKVPQAAIDRVEVQRGSGSDLYGADAVGGVVQLLTLRPTRPAGRALLEAGTLGTGRVSLFGGSRSPRLAIQRRRRVVHDRRLHPDRDRAGSRHCSSRAGRRQAGVDASIRARVGGLSGGRRLARRHRRQRVRRASAERDADLHQQHRVAPTVGRAGGRGRRRPPQSARLRWDAAVPAGVHHRQRRAHRRNTHSRSECSLERVRAGWPVVPRLGTPRRAGRRRGPPCRRDLDRNPVHAGPAAGGHRGRRARSAWVRRSSRTPSASTIGPPW